jgi:ATP synthase protein I
VKIIPAKNSTVSQTVVETSSTSVSDGMEEYNRLKFKLLVLTLASGVIIGLVVWFWYGWTIALSYAVGALVGAVYFRMLTKSVDRLGGESNRLGFSRLGLFVILIAIAAKSDQLEILPAFFGFMTYKVAVLVILAQDLSNGFHSR